MHTCQNSYSNVGEAFIDGVCNTISTMTGQSICANINTTNKHEYSVSGVMVMLGKKTGVLVLSTSKEGALHLVENMTGSDVGEISENDIYDGMAEIVNMVAGVAKAHLVETDYFFKLTSPVTILGEKFKMIIKEYIESYEYYFEVNGFELKLSILYIC